MDMELNILIMMLIEKPCIKKISYLSHFSRGVHNRNLLSNSVNDLFSSLLFIILLLARLVLLVSVTLGMSFGNN